MAKYYRNPDSTHILLESDDVLDLSEPLGSAVVDQRMAAAHWLPDFIRYQWAPAQPEFQSSTIHNPRRSRKVPGRRASTDRYPLGERGISPFLSNRGG